MLWFFKSETLAALVPCSWMLRVLWQAGFEDDLVRRLQAHPGLQRVGWQQLMQRLEGIPRFAKFPATQKFQPCLF
jgi:hypothetical protein